MTTDGPQSTPAGVSAELRPYVDRHEAEAIDRLGERLTAERPPPRAAFRSELRALLGRRLQSATEWRPARLRLSVAAYLGSGCLLMLIAAIGLAGAGPLAP